MNIFKICAIFLILAFSPLANASVLVRPYTSADYAGGAKAVGSKVNAEFANIVNWLNGGNIASGNIAAFGVETTNLSEEGVTTGKIADGSVTTAKLASQSVTTSKLGLSSVTRANLATIGQQVSSSSGSFSMLGTTPTDVTNLSVTITTTGRPVFIAIIPDGNNTNNTSQMFLTSATASDVDAFGWVRILRGGSFFSEQAVGHRAGAPGGGQLPRTYAPANLFTFDFPAAGTYTYKVQVYAALSSMNFALNYARLVAYEL